MTMRILIECDGINCSEQTEIDEPTSDNVAEHGWLNDPYQEEFHYCPACAPFAKAEWESDPFIER